MDSTVYLEDMTWDQGNYTHLLFSCIVSTCCLDYTKASVKKTLPQRVTVDLVHYLTLKHTDLKSKIKSDFIYSI